MLELFREQELRLIRYPELRVARLSGVVRSPNGLKLGAAELHARAQHSAPPLESDPAHALSVHNLPSKTPLTNSAPNLTVLRVRVQMSDPELERSTFGTFLRYSN